MNRQWSLSFWVGAFVAGALLIGVVGLIVIGGGHWFRDASRVVMYFNESVHNLEVGAAVKINGVRTGRVESINVLLDQEKALTRAQVVMVLDRARLIDGQGGVVNLGQRERLESLVEEGLRARLALTGITGLLYVDLFMMPDPAPFQTFDGGLTGWPEIPTRSSPLSELSETLTETIANLSRVDLAGLASEFQGLMKTVRRQLEMADLPSRATQAGDLMEALKGYLEGDELVRLMASWEETMATIRRVADETGEGIGPLLGEIRQAANALQSAVQRWEETAGQVNAFLDARHPMSRPWREAIRRVGEGAAAVERLADYLERHPDALLRGRYNEPNYP